MANKILLFTYKSKVDYPVKVGPYWLSPNGSFTIKEDIKVNPKEVFKKEA